MGYQSAALAYNFGLNYEFGKRVIKSMSNEKFNKIAEDPILLNELTSRHHDVLLKAFINEVPKVDKIQDLIIKKMVELEFAKIKVMPELIAQIPKGFIEGIFSLGSGGSPQDIKTIPPPVTQPRGKTIQPKGPKIITVTHAFLEANAQGKIIVVKFRGQRDKHRIQTKFGNKWNTLNTFNERVDAVAFARQSWPNSGYKTHTVGRTRQSLGTQYWTLKSKF